MFFSVKQFLIVLVVALIASGIEAVEKHARKPQGFGREIDVRNEAEFGIIDETPGKLY